MTPRKSIIPIFVPHLGCPHDCVFCNQRRISGALSPASAKDVRRVVSEALPKINGEAQIAFYGGSFTAIEKEVQIELLDAAGEFFGNGRISDLRVSTRPDAINEEIVSFLKSKGVSTIELGVQSMDEDVLLRSGRGHTALDAVRASEIVKAAGLTLILQMMTGLPGSSKEKDILTAEKIASLNPDGVRIYPAVIIKDTAMHDMWKGGKYSEHTVEDAVSVCSEIVPIFENCGITIIRLGLNPSDDLSSGDAAGGAYHPALGELVKSRILRNKAESLLKEADAFKKDVALSVNASQISQMTGQHRSNVNYLSDKFSLKSLKIVGGQNEKGEISLSIAE